MKQVLNSKMLDAVSRPHKRIVYGDSKAKNLLVMIQPTGRICWMWQGRVGGKTKQVLLGYYPTMGVPEARKAAGAFSDARDVAKLSGKDFELPRIRTSPASLVSVQNVTPQLVLPTSGKDC